MWAKNKQRGFTIVELLIVIVVIAILAAITIVAYNGLQQRSRDSARAQDIAGIKKALLMYQADNGGVRTTSSYGGNGPGGWNLSSGANWLTFLGTTYGKIPADPTNTGTADPLGPSGGLAYFYYCYGAGSGPLPATANVRLGYRSEVSNQNVYTDMAVERCF
jgi:prepilin-type N-terminal cleavage/methylation domain-containing protein